MLTTSSGAPGIPVFVGILVGLLASFVQSLGLTIQRKSHIQNDGKPVERRKKAHRRPLWLLGFAVFISSNLFGTVFQIGALPIVILAPLGAVSLLWNALLCRILLREHFSASTLLGTLFIATGAVLIAVFGVVPEQNHSLEELLELFARPAFVAYFTLMGIAVVAVLAISHLVEFGIRKSLERISLPISTPDQSPASSYKPLPTDARSIPFRVTQGSRRWSAPSTPPTVPGTLPTPSLGDEHPIQEADTPIRSRKHVTIVLPPNPRVDALPSPSDHAASAREPSPRQARTLVLLGMAFAACSGTLSGMCLLFAKCAVELLILTFASHGADNQFKRFQSWALVGGLGVAALAQLFYLNHSLRLAGPALICPLAFCFYNISSIFDGLVFYSQFSELAPYQIVLVTVGIAVLLVGVWSVSTVEPSTGCGGVEVNGWADDRMMEVDDSEVDASSRPLLDGRYYQDEPERYQDTALASEPSTPLPPLEGTAFPHGPPPPASLPTSPLSPYSPTARRFRSDLGRRASIQARFGTLIPELAPAGVPAGFAIGLNTSSPGFVLRSVEHGAVPPEEYGQIGLGLGRFRSRSLSLGSSDGRVRTGDDVDHQRESVSFPPDQVGSGIDVKRDDESPREGWMGWFKRTLGLGRSGGEIRLPDDDEPS